METAYRLKLSTLSLLHDPAGQPEERLIPPQHAHDALDAVAHTRSLQHTGNCTLCLLLDLQHAQKLQTRCPFAQQSPFALIVTVCDHYMWGMMLAFCEICATELSVKTLGVNNAR